MRRLVTFSIIGLFVLMAGCSNAISLGLAGALERRREVGIRKAVGAVQRSIVMQYLGESMSLATV
jgi:putative ABC transport system permease protein